MKTKRATSLGALAPALTGRPSLAFTRVELCALLAALAVLAIVRLPVLADGRSRSGLLVCFNNLRLIGRALLSWEAEHGYALPWRTEVSLGGTYVPAGTTPPPWIDLRNNSWFQFSLLSNDLASPRILACPSDSARPARDFSASADGGFLNANYRNNSVSYLIQLDGGSELGDWILSGDRSLRANIGPASCSSGIRANRSLLMPALPNFGWELGTHGSFGNLLFHDGRVVQFQDGERLRSAVDLNTDNAVLHLLVP